MKVEGILAAKGRGVITVTPEATIAEVVGVLAEHRIGAVVVSDGEGGVAGILTERDVVRVLAASGAEALRQTTATLMTRDVVTAHVGDTLDDLSERMTRGRFRHIPIMDGVKLAGMISIGDVVKHRIESIEAEASAMREYIATA